MEQEYYIYKITCIPENRVYVGQTQKFKHKDGKPYRYGIAGRWCDHVSSSRVKESPLSLAIQEHGADQFTHEMLEQVSEGTADEREAYWIQHLNSQVPQGFNVKSHSRCKHRETTSIASLYLNSATEVEQRVIKREGVPRLVYVYVTLPSEKKRFVFGQTKGSLFEDTLEESNAFVKLFEESGVHIKYETTRTQFATQELRKIRLVPFNKTMVAVYITPKSGLRQRTCFGGKHVSFEDATKLALEFVNGLTCDVIENTLFKSRQQATTFTDEATSVEDK